MKQQMKKILAVLFVILMAFSMLPGSYLQTDAAKKKTVKVTSVTLNKKTATIIKGQKLTLRATLNPKNTTQKSLRWSTSNKKIATVNAKGVVNGVKKGTATITATVKGTSKKATCKITVKAKPVVKVSALAFSVKEKTMGQGGCLPDETLYFSIQCNQ